MAPPWPAGHGERVGARIVWLAVDEARGHLMRAHLARELLAPSDIGVEIVTTSEQGRAFLAMLGSPCRVLPGGHHLVYDAAHNFQARPTAAALRRYFALPSGLTADLDALHRVCVGCDLIVDDSLHPALLLAGWQPQLHRRLVRVYGQHLPHAVETTLRTRARGGRPLAWMFRHACRRARAHVEHTLDVDRLGSGWCLPPLIDRPRRSRATVRRELGVRPGQRLAVVYLNPRFADPALATAIERALAAHRIVGHLVGEGFRSAAVGWDPRLTDVVAAADVLVAGAGMGALGHVAAFGVPFVALGSQQPEQQRNLAFLPRLGAAHAVVDVNDRAGLSRGLQRALASATSLGRRPGHPQFGPEPARAAWSSTFHHLLDSSPHDHTQSAL